jgi:hypothetical protein
MVSREIKEYARGIVLAVWLGTTNVGSFRLSVRSQSFHQLIRIRTSAVPRLDSDKTSARRSAGRNRGSTRLMGSLFCLVLLPWLFGTTEVRAQTAATKSASAAQPTAAQSVPLGRYIPKDNLIVYVEFEGLDSHAASWQNTAAFKMLTGTPLGGMLEEVSAQLLDKALTFFPNRRLNGAEVVTLFKHAAKSGWVLAINANPKGPDALRGTFVLRGGVSKELMPITSRAMGWLMGNDAKYRIEPRENRTLVIVPPGGQGASVGLDAGWAWWPEKKTDLVVGFLSPSSTDAIIATLDGKSPSAVDHALVQELKKTEGTFEPVCIALAETALCPESSARLVGTLRRLHAERGVNRIDLRWGFDAEALMSVTRLTAPLPRKPGLAMFDKPTFEKNALLPMPDAVGSFVELSTSPSKMLEALEVMDPEGEFKQQIDQLTEAIRTAGSIDLQKDLLAHIGPRMVAYLGPGRSAATNDDSLEAALKNGLTMTGAVTAMQTLFPKLTLVAEVKNPQAFGKALDPAMIAINNELKAQAMEKAAEDRAASQTSSSAGAGRMAPGRPGAERTKRRQELSYPKFTPVPGETKSFVLTTPSDSVLRFGPSSFRPTILVQDKYVAFAVSSDAARAAIAAVRRKDWKPSAELERACQKVPSNLVLLSVTDVSESLSSLLSSLPGTLQTMINTSIALAKARSGDAKSTSTGPGASATGMSRSGASGESRRSMGGPRGAMVGGGSPGGANTERSGGMRPPTPTPGGGNSTSSSTSESMITLKIDPDKLPKAADLRANLFASTLSASVADQEIRFVSRGAFPDLSLPIGLVPVAGVMPALQSLLETAQAQPAAAPAAGAPSAGNQSAPAKGEPPEGRVPGKRGRRAG